VDPVEHGQTEPGQVSCDGLVGGQHELFDYLMRD
jgi:hypothetical protein